MDLSILLLLSAFVIATAFSKSQVTSILGFDGRLGDGVLGILLLITFSYVTRSFVSGIDGIIHSIMYVLIGISIGALISVVSFWGMNLLQFIPAFDTLFTVGLPIYTSARVSLVVFGVSTLMSVGLIFFSLKKYNIGLLITSILMFLINGLAVLLFSIVQGSEQVTLLIAVLALFTTLPFMRKRPLNATFVGVSWITTIVIIVGFLLLKVPQLKDFVIIDSSNLITQVTISPEVGWKIATNAVSESFWNGVVGYGLDTFSIAYNIYRPLTDEILVLNNTNFTFPSNQLLNIFISTGILGVLAWAFLLFNKVIETIEDLKKRNFVDAEDFILLMLNLVAIYILVSSVFIYFTFFVYLLLFLSISLSTILRYNGKEDKAEKFVLNLNMFTQKEEQGVVKNSMIVIVVLMLPLVWLYSKVLASTSASFSVLEAERITAEGRELNDRGKLGENKRLEMLVDASNLYGNAIAQVPYNDMYHRRASLILSQYVELLVTKYNKSDVESEKKELFEDITAYADIAVEEAKLATDRAPEIYANWGTRANVYSKIVGIGFKVYSKSALSAMQQAASLNPLNYELYYNAAQLYVINNDNDSAIRTLAQVFTINPEHIPSSVLAGELSLNDKDYKQADRYFNDAKDVMDKYGDTDSELYKYVVKRLTEITPLLPKPEVKDEKKSETSSDQGSDSLKDTLPSTLPNN